jgi:DNA-binding NarL/FixJ family response regulator
MPMGRKRILIADAHPTMMAGVRLLLKDSFDAMHMVADESSLRDAVEKGEFDLVIVDLSMPISSGENVSRFLRRVSPEVKLIVLSVHDDPVAASECLAAGAKGFVLKRAAVNDLVPAVEGVLRGEVYVSPDIQINYDKASPKTGKVRNPRERR